MPAEAPEIFQAAPAPIRGPISLPAPAAPRPETVNWQAEVSKRVQGFRRRRTQQGGKDEAGGSLEFDFDAAGISREAENLPGMDFPVSAPALPPLDPGTLEAEPAPRPRPSRIDEVSLWYDQPSALPDNAPSTRNAEPVPVAIVVESPSLQATVGNAPYAVDSLGAVAKPGPRFLAGLLDAAVLLAGAGVFALIFWRTGGRLLRDPLDIAVVAFITCIFTLLYFSVMTAMMSSTPGLIWMGLEIRASNGKEPSLRDALWRAVGCLISAGALMLGFIWAYVDSDGLTWHDRISGTFISSSERWPAATSGQTETPAQDPVPDSHP